jgi:hypothetical protein
MSSVAAFAKANVDELVDALSQDEAIALTAGVGFWNTAAVPRLGIPTIKVRTTSKDRPRHSQQRRSPMDQMGFEATGSSTRLRQRRYQSVVKLLHEHVLIIPRRVQLPLAPRSILC